MEDPTELPQAIVGQQLQQQLSPVTGWLNQMRAFNLTDGAAASAHASITSQVEALRDWLAQYIRPFLRGPVVDVNLQRAEMDRLLEGARSTGAELDDILSRVREAVGRTGAAQLSSYYETEAKGHGRRATAFLRWGAGLLVLAVFGGMVIFVWHPLPVVLTGSSSVRWEEFTRALIVRLLYLAVVSYVMAFLARNFRVEKHLEVANEQKRNALNTYVLFTEAISNDETRGVVAAELVHAVFGPTETGFISGVQERTIVESAPGIAGLLTRTPNA